MKKNEARIRAIAHQIWEEVGRPEDQAKLHWEMAERELEEADPAKKQAKAGRRKKKLPVLKTAPMA